MGLVSTISNVEEIVRKTRNLLSPTEKGNLAIQQIYDTLDELEKRTKGLEQKFYNKCNDNIKDLKTLRKEVSEVMKKSNLDELNISNIYKKLIDEFRIKYGYGGITSKDFIDLLNGQPTGVFQSLGTEPHNWFMDIVESECINIATDQIPSKIEELLNKKIDDYNNSNKNNSIGNELSKITNLKEKIECNFIFKNGKNEIILRMKSNENGKHNSLGDYKKRIDTLYKNDNPNSLGIYEQVNKNTIPDELFDYIRDNYIKDSDFKKIMNDNRQVIKSDIAFNLTSSGISGFLGELNALLVSKYLFPELTSRSTGKQLLNALTNRKQSDVIDFMIEKVGFSIKHYASNIITWDGNNKLVGDFYRGRGQAKFSDVFIDFFAARQFNQPFDSDFWVREKAHDKDEYERYESFYKENLDSKELIDEMMKVSENLAYGIAGIERQFKGKAKNIIRTNTFFWINGEIYPASKIIAAMKNSLDKTNSSINTEYENKNLISSKVTFNYGEKTQRSLGQLIKDGGNKNSVHTESLMYYANQQTMNYRVVINFDTFKKYLESDS